MKKVLLLTLHSQNNNFGSVLQAYSLYKYIEELGFDVTVLNYRPYYSNGATNLKNATKKIATNFMFLYPYIKRTAKFNILLKEEKLTKRIRKYSDLKQCAEGYDIYLIGSDQVWNPSYLCGQDPAYYYKFVQQGKKISYAASLGSQNHDETTLKLIANNIEQFQYVSLREQKSVEQLGYVGYNKAQYVLDPVFLYDVEHYRKMQSDYDRSGYILAYIIEQDEFIANVVEKIAKLTGKKIIQVGGFAPKCKYDEFPRDAGPSDFLAIIDHADFVVTSSFHGTAFAHIYQKQFFVVMPSKNKLRIENILETAGTQHRVIRFIEDVEKMMNPIDYSIVNKRIEIMRQKSKNYLLTGLADKELKNDYL